MNLSIAMHKINNLVEATTSKLTKKNLLDEIAQQIKIKNSVDNRLIDEVESIIRRFIKTLTPKEVLSVWGETDIGLIQTAESFDMQIDASSAAFDLEMELLSEYTSFLWKEYGGGKKAPR